MSSSTVSITANRSAASLRKPGDKNMAATDGTDASPVNEKDLRAGPETVVERSKDTVQTKNPLPTKLRKRTVVKKGGGLPSSSRPPWKTAVSVIIKNLGLLVILLLLAQMIRRLAFNQDPFIISNSNPISIPNSDYERRIAEVETLLKTTTKMIQVQVDIVDRKLEDEIAGLKSELSKRIDDERAVDSDRFTEYDKRIESLDESLTATQWLTKDEFDKFVEEFKGKRGVTDIRELKLDEIRAFAREMVEKEIGKHAADGLGRVDYAVASGGAMVVKHSEPFSGASRVRSWFSGNVRSDAMKVLQPSFGQPGECFPLKGDAGFVEIKLRTAIVPEAITLEHVSESVAFDRSSAPKDCKVWGWANNEGDDAQNEHLLTEFSYDLEKSTAQTFNVLDAKGVDSIIVDTIRLQFTSNHGSPTHTCIYRVRVHGHQPNAA